MTPEVLNEIEHMINNMERTSAILAKVKQAIQAEREVCAQVADAEAKNELQWMLHYKKHNGIYDTRVTECLGGHKSAQDIAHAIRARSAE